MAYCTARMSMFVIGYKSSYDDEDDDDELLQLQVWNLWNKREKK